MPLVGGREACGRGKAQAWKSGNRRPSPGRVISLSETQFPYLKNDVRLMIS